MEKFVKGEIVILPFPFSDLSGAKKRPAFVLADLEGDDIILCQITSQLVKDNHAVTIKNSDFKSGELVMESNIRPNRIFTADKKIIIRKAGFLKEQKTKEVVGRVVNIITGK